MLFDNVSSAFEVVQIVVSALIGHVWCGCGFERLRL